MISMSFSFWRGGLKSGLSKHSWSFAEELLHLTFHSHCCCFPSMKRFLFVWKDVPHLRCWHTTSELLVLVSEPMGFHAPSHCTSTRPEQFPRPSLKRTFKLPAISKTKLKSLVWHRFYQLWLNLFVLDSEFVIINRKAVLVTWTYNVGSSALFFLVNCQAMPQWLLIALALNITQQTIICKGALFHSQHLATAKLSTDHRPHFFTGLIRILITVAHLMVNTIHINGNISKTLWCEVVEFHAVCVNTNVIVTMPNKKGQNSNTL